MSKGVIQQVDTPFNIYKNPSNIFVATFIGHTNILQGTFSNGSISLDCGYSFKYVHKKTPEQARVSVGIRPERFILLERKTKDGILGTVELVTFLGQSVQYQIQINSTNQEIELEADKFKVKET